MALKLLSKKFTCVVFYIVISGEPLDDYSVHAMTH